MFVKAKDSIIRALFLTIDGKTVTFPEGAIEGEAAEQLIDELQDRWNSLEGSRDTRMSAEKLGRAEHLRVADNEIRFEIERHPGSHNGSTRACVQTWAVDLRTSSAAIVSESHRQIKPRARSYTKADAKADAHCVLRILTGRRKNRGELVQEDGQRYLLMASSFVDLGEFKQTRVGRRRQFIGALEKVLGTKGWSVWGNPWEPTPIQIWRSSEH